jgi:mono/diheme cytochrome c family protein
MAMVTACATRHPTEDRVPLSAMKAALALKPPYGDARSAAPDIVAAGKVIYEGKGRCFFCHGSNGKGDGPAAHLHSKQPPRNFTDCAFQNAREDGELYWIIKNGSPGTGMQALIPAMLTEEEGWDVVAYIRTFCAAHS